MLLTAVLSLVSAHSVLAAEAPSPTVTPRAVYPNLAARQSGAAAPSTYETTSPLPLTEYFYPYDAIPQQVNPYPILRGPQSGYNKCDNSTEGPDALCQTAVFNSIEDFCFWGAPGTSGNETIGDVEAAVVAYCSRSGHGARIFPQGTFASIQFMRTPAYIQIVGFFNQTGVGLNEADTGGELDPHGADLMGNPLGGLFYSNGFSSGDNKTYVQTQSWNHFVGANQFCLKLCDPNYKTDKNYCQNIYDLIGCSYNMPADYAALKAGNTFISCEGEIQDEVGTYVSNGQTLTWSQPDPVATPPPWTPRIPASSNCVTYQSTDLFPASLLGYQGTSTLNPSPSAVPSSSGFDASGSSSDSKKQAAATTGAKSSANGAALPSVGHCALIAASVMAFFL